MSPDDDFIKGLQQNEEYSHWQSGGSGKGNVCGERQSCSDRVHNKPDELTGPAIVYFKKILHFGGFYYRAFIQVSQSKR